MCTEALTVPFNGKSTTLSAILVDITPNLYSEREALEIMRRLAEMSSDETDCSGKASVQADSMTTIDGKVAPDIYKLRMDNKRMVYEVNRLETFKTWSERNPLRPGPLARAGFYYSGVHDMVKCFSCGGQVQDWEFGDTAMGEHSRHFPGCRFVQGKDTQNVALLELAERPEYERKLSGRIEQSQRDIEHRAKEKEAMLLQEQGGSKTEARGHHSAAAASSSSSSSSSLHELEDDTMAEGDQGNGSSFGKFHKEFVRLKSFEKWPRTSPIEPRDLAKVGFYYTNSEDSVQCFACFGQISRWKPFDVPATEHKKHFPNCPFVQGLDVGNEPISAPPVFPSGLPTPTRSVSAPQPTREQQRVGRELQRQGSGQLRAYMGPLNNCRHPVFAQEDARLRTFQNWPPYLRISATPRLLARAGFFYTGSVDECKCFYCDGGLKNWEPNDEPWAEHAKWFPRCEWLLQQRGQAYITHVQRVNPPPIGSAPMQQMHFTSPRIGQDEPYFQPPHVLQASYVQRPPPTQVPSVSGRGQEGQKKEPTIEEEKAAALREYAQKNMEPEAAAEVNFIKKPKASEGGRHTPPKSKPGKKLENEKPSIDDLLKSPTAQMAAEMGFDTRLIRYVIAERLRKRGREFSSPEELLESIWEAEKMDIDLSTLDMCNQGSSGKAAGVFSSDDEEHSQKPGSKLDGSDPSLFVDIQARKLAGLSINEDPADDEGVKAMSSQSSRAPRVVSPQPLTSGTSESLEDKQLCKICLDKELNTVFMPCKHLATCEKCASMVSECPMCRQTILTSFQVYMP